MGCSQKSQTILLKCKRPVNHTAYEFIQLSHGSFVTVLRIVPLSAAYLLERELGVCQRRRTRRILHPAHHRHQTSVASAVTDLCRVQGEEMGSAAVEGGDWRIHLRKAFDQSRLLAS